MSLITTHVLDTSTGRPAAGVPVRLERKTKTSDWHFVGETVTDGDGRIKDFGPAAGDLGSGNYKLTFATADYFHMRDIECFFPEVTIAFVADDLSQHFHVPLLLSPFGYSTYRGS